MPDHAVSSRRTMLAGATALLAVAGCATGEPSTTGGRRGPIREAIAQRRQGATVETPQPSATPAETSDPHVMAGPQGVEMIEDVWTDRSRDNRQTPWRAYLPAGGRGPVPVAIFSHGGGGTRESGAQYGRHLASHGIASLHLQHLGSDRDAFRSNPQQISAAARDPRAGAPRFEDVGFVYRRLQSDAGVLKDRIDAGRCGIYGHSFGAITTQIIAGQAVTGFDQSFALPDLKGALALSPSPPREAYGDSSTAFRSMLMPMFSLTGTEDDAPNGDFNAPARRTPFDQISNVEQFLTILDGANHFTFGGDPNPQLRGQSFSYPGLDRHHGIIRAGTLAFFNLVLRGDTAERPYLQGQGFRALLSATDVHEHKAGA